ncbi:DUF481 domain-containing protein [Pseudomaricurvus alcaniphilus]|uniref:DUF481 domain-containing protein n=1 Tax=Pseudomaricurvus alcaniphilus TaxID=1166482 RepID=UPI00140AD083|nr:DUF481 domain-containing protein [Pseudomaricurvus alcaniphilus]NHN38087.1 DUF481 domain-containing protein [Pseudomaricurvus alcaniphilus]
MRFFTAASTLMLACFLFSAAASAGELLLTNGDRLEGNLVLIDKTTVTWKSTVFGNLTVGKNRVANLKLDKPVVIQGQRDPCVVEGMTDYFLAYRCGKSTYIQRTELLTLASVEPYVEDKDKTYEYNGAMSVAGVLSRGNKVEDDLDVDAIATFRHGNFRHINEIDYEALSRNDLPALEDYELSYRLDWFFDEKWFWYNALGMGMEESKNIKERYEYGTGLGVQMWENINSALALESGIDFVKERYEQVVSDDKEAAAWRFATRFRHKLPFNMALVHSNEVLYSLEDSGDWELSADVGISLPLGPGLFSEYKIEYDYDNQPAEGTKRDDTKLTIGIGYKW